MGKMGNRYLRHFVLVVRGKNSSLTHFEPPHALDWTVLLSYSDAQERRSGILTVLSVPAEAWPHPSNTEAWRPVGHVGDRYSFEERFYGFRRQEAGDVCLISEFAESLKGRPFVPGRVSDVV